VDGRRVLAHRDDPGRMLGAADEVQVGQLRDRVTQRVVERPEGLLAAVEMDDRDPEDRRGERGGRRLEPIAGEDDRVHGVAPQLVADGREGGGCLDVGGRVGRPRPSQSSAASGSNPAAIISSSGRPWRDESCMPPAMRRSRRPGSSRIAAATEWRIPQSWRPVVRTAIVRDRDGDRGAGQRAARLRDVRGPWRSRTQSPHAAANASAITRSAGSSTSTLRSAGISMPIVSGPTNRRSARSRAGSTT
jgi:hypothetical protein